MGEWKIYYGLGGGFGGAKFSHIETGCGRVTAEEIAFQLAVEEYESYGGYHGLTSYDEIRENLEDYGLDEEATDEDIWMAYMEEVNSWIEYYAVEYDGREIDDDGEPIEEEE